MNKYSTDLFFTITVCMPNAEGCKNSEEGRDHWLGLPQCG